MKWNLIRGTNKNHLNLLKLVALVKIIKQDLDLRVQAATKV